MSTPNSPVDGAVEAASRPAWADRAAEQSRSVQRSRARSIAQAQTIVAAAERLLHVRGSAFTTQELAKEAGIALQTFYRHFAGKDQLLLALFEEVIARQAAEAEAAARDLPDPVARLHFYIVGTLRSLRDEQGQGPRAITSEHWRLYQLFPEEMTKANQPFADLVERELRAGAAEGVLRPGDPATGAWLAMKLVMSVFHHYAFAPVRDDIAETAERTWSFCLAAFGGPIH